MYSIPDILKLLYYIFSNWLDRWRVHGEFTPPLNLLNFVGTRYLKIFEDQSSQTYLFSHQIILTKFLRISLVQLSEKFSLQLVMSRYSGERGHYPACVTPWDRNKNSTFLGLGIPSTTLSYREIGTTAWVLKTFSRSKRTNKFQKSERCRKNQRVGTTAKREPTPEIGTRAF